MLSRHVSLQGCPQAPAYRVCYSYVRHVHWSCVHMLWGSRCVAGAMLLPHPLSPLRVHFQAFEQQTCSCCDTPVASPGFCSRRHWALACSPPARDGVVSLRHHAGAVGPAYPTLGAVSAAPRHCQCSPLSHAPAVQVYSYLLETMMTVFRRDLTTVAQAKAVLRVMGMEERATELKILYLGNER